MHIGNRLVAKNILNVSVTHQSYNDGSRRHLLIFFANMIILQIGCIVRFVKQLFKSVSSKTNCPRSIIVRLSIYVAL